MVAIDFFTKWVEVKPTKKVKQANIIEFIKKNMSHRFGILELIITYQGMMFIGNKEKAFVNDYAIKMLNSTYYYA